MGIGITLYGQLTYLIVTESHALGLAEKILSYSLQTAGSRKMLLDAVYVGQTAQEPLVNACKLMQTVHCVTLSERKLQSRQTLIGRIYQLSLDIGNLDGVAHESVQALSDHTHTFLDSLLEGTSY